MPHKILIVDDDDDFAEAITAFLEANAYAVVRARDGREGCRLAETERPDLILMDIVMDERTEGFFAVQELRRSERLRHIPIFVLTSLYTKEDEFKVAPDRAWLAHDEFFPKPVKMPDLLERIDARLRVNATPTGKDPIER